ncbi:UDP-glucose 4-epimerase family protein [Hydrogenophaga sp. A37]|uniref:UDP-glucose 4-epimerase family protein n=1 Tax=Hydrogenophaga sp. A37 TaxID=1945864 RepID=UPI0009877BAD|nr:SDR family oxidoreductase [Hydrogenophaga sp. A37]OOG80079.1 UDP-glucose 4-epimerase [Hydrogenophaga sp. A37]
MTGTIAVTGASGFVGRALCARLREQGRSVLPLVRTATLEQADARVVGDLGPETDWSHALQGIDCVVHCAARVHVMRDDEPDPLGAFRRVNVEGTQALALAAAAAGARRLVFVSSLKVHGEQTLPGVPFQAHTPPAPQDAYGQSKWEAEQALWKVSATTGLEIAVVRPPLVYGPGVKANFLKLMQLVAKGLPLPFGGIHNHRSLLALGNLTDLLQICTDHPNAAGQTFLASDDQDMSTPELIRGLAAAMGRRATLLPVPVSWLRLAGLLTGQTPQIERLMGSLQVDIGHTREVLSWSPPWSVQQGLKLAVQDVMR